MAATTATLHRLEGLLKRHGLSLPQSHRWALCEDLQGVREEGYPTLDDAWRELLRRIGGRRNLVRYTNTLVPPQARLPH